MFFGLFFMKNCFGMYVFEKHVISPATALILGKTLFVISFSFFFFWFLDIMENPYFANTHLFNPLEQLSLQFS